MRIEPNWIYRFYVIERNGEKCCRLQTGSLGSDLIISRRVDGDVRAIDINQVELSIPEYLIAGWANPEHGFCAEGVAFLSIDADHFVYRQVIDGFDRTIVGIPYREVSAEELEYM